MQVNIKLTNHNTSNDLCLFPDWTGIKFFLHIFDESNLFRAFLMFWNRNLYTVWTVSNNNHANVIVQLTSKLTDEPDQPFSSLPFAQIERKEKQMSDTFND
jgi:hypothetical protein